MEFKKIAQVVWMILAAIFVLSILLLAYSESIFIYEKSTSQGTAFIKFNKITGRTYGIVPAKSGKWIRVR